MQWPLNVISICYVLTGLLIGLGTISTAAMQADPNHTLDLRTMDAASWVWMWFGVMCLITGVAIRRGHEWARICGIVVAALIILVCFAGLVLVIQGINLGPNPRIKATAIQAILASQLFSLLVLVFAWKRSGDGLYPDRPRTRT